MLKIMKISNEGWLEDLKEGLPDQAKTIVEAEKIIGSGDLPEGEYLVIAIHGKFKATEERKIQIEKLDYGAMFRA